MFNLTNDDEWAKVIASTKETLPEIFVVDHCPVPSAIHRSIDHTLLALSATDEQVDILCSEACEHRFATVCVRLGHVQRAVNNVKACSEVAVACVVGFHEGMYETSEKVREAEKAVELGARELDMVMKWPLLKEGQYIEVFSDILAVRRAAPFPVKLKVILETSQLNPDQVIAGTTLAVKAGADFVKTSTGFNGPGANIDNVALIRATVDSLGGESKVKASGGVRSAEDCIRMLKAGAHRVGTSSGTRIIRELGGEELLERGASRTVY